jgi:formylglycine-generating enzyme required for sulfatase activity
MSSVNVFAVSTGYHYRTSIIGVLLVLVSVGCGSSGASNVEQPDASNDSAESDAAMGGDRPDSSDATPDISYEDGPPNASGSCAASGGQGVSNCGAASDSCCASTTVPGGMFYRSYDGVTFPQMLSPATVSAFRFDKYEVTVGRFRRFVGAVVGGWTPAAGAGKHVHLNGGRGLAAASEADASTGTYELGWDSSWTSQLPASQAAWNAALACSPSATWTATAGANESLPMTCETWFEAYAFCIWDGGFLPSNAEWNYAAAGGGQQRAYPWSAPASSMVVDCQHGNDDMCGDNAKGVGLESPVGDGLWGQTDLAGNVMERTLDLYSQYYAVPCVDCATLSATTTSRVGRGGDYHTQPQYLLVGYEDAEDPSGRDDAIGVRCARVP